MNQYQNSIDKILTSKSFWAVVSFFILFVYLLPLFLPTLHSAVYDNLDSNVIWYKMLAKSGKIFASNSDIIPNMMNGLPRASFGSEFSILLWLYYFFGAKSAYIINEFIIHIVAFTGAYLLISKHFVKEDCKYRYFLIFTASIYFALLPFWSGSGITIASLPLTTFILLEIKNNRDSFIHWLGLAFIVFYSSFVLLYIFYIAYSILFLIYDSIKNRAFNRRLAYAILFIIALFIFRDYRLFYSIFFDSSFISHRVEFDVFFQEDFMRVWRFSILQNLLIGIHPHLPSLQQLYILPLAVVTLLTLIINKDTLDKKESIMLWSLVMLLFFINLLFNENIWFKLFSSNYFPIILLLLAIIALFRDKEYRTLPILIIFAVIFALIFGISNLKPLHWLIDIVPLLKSFNLTRASYVEPLIWLLIFLFSSYILLKKVKYSLYFLPIILLMHIDFAFNESYYPTYAKRGYFTFKEYYDPELFNKIKKDIEKDEKKDIKEIRVVHYGIEPAPALYNGFYTVDGYSANYPLSYKKAFRKTQAKQLLDVKLKIVDANRKLYDKWGSKVYLLAVNSEPESYRFYTKKKVLPSPVNFLADYDALCDLNTSYVISAYPLKNIDKKRLKFKKLYKGVFWNIWLYRLNCKK